MFQRKFLTRYSISFLFLLLSLGFAARIFACEPPPGRNPSDFTFEDRIDNAPLVLVGRVVGNVPDYGFIDIAEVEVETYIKGEGLAVVRISGFGEGLGDCWSSVHLGERYVFLANGTMGETLHAQYFTMQDAVFDADEETVARAIAHTGQSNQPIPLPFGMQVQRWTQKYAPYTIGLLVILGVIAAAFMVKWRMSDGRKSKTKFG